MRYLSFVLIGLIVTGCVSTGANFPSRTDWIEKNKTKVDDVELVLGKPFAVGDSGGTKTWTYGFYRFVFPNRSYHKELKLYWNQDRTVKHYSFNSSFPTDISKANRSGKKLKSVPNS